MSSLPPGSIAAADPQQIELSWTAPLPAVSTEPVIPPVRLLRAHVPANPHAANDCARNPSVNVDHDDCIEFLNGLPAHRIDVIVTDPAYSGMNNKLQLGKGRIVGQYRDRGGAGAKWFAEFEDTADNYAAFLRACRRALAPRGHIYLMFDSFSLLSLAPIVREFFDVKNIITWDKVAIGMGHYFRRRHEYVLFATNGNNRKLRTRAMPDVWRFKRVRSAAYSTQKPVEVFEAMLYASAPAGALMCDPFVGSGSSAVAAIRRGCDFVGCDAAERAVELARNRVATYIATGQDPLQPFSAAIAGEPVFWRESTPPEAHTTASRADTASEASAAHGAAHRSRGPRRN